jgi:hypothetical protein
VTIVELIDTAHEKSLGSPAQFKFRNVFVAVTERYQLVPRSSKRSGVITVLYGAAANAEARVGELDIDANGIVTKFEPDPAAPYYVVKPFIDALT